MRQARLWILFTLIAAAAWCQPGPGTSEFRVNTSRQDAERDPAVAQNAAGEFVVAWRGEDQYSGYLGRFVYPAGIFAQRFDRDGRPQGGELQVNTANMGEYGYGPDVAIDGAGRFLVVWAAELGTGTFARRYGVDGEPLGEPEKIGALGVPALAGDEAGNALAVTSHPHRGAQAVTGRLFDAAEAAWREPFEIQESFPQGVVPANVALDTSGGFVVVWRRDEDVLGRRFTSAGEPREGELVLNQESAPWPYSEDDRRASVGADGDGGFVVVWARDEEVGTSLRARRFDAASEPRGDEVVLSPPGFHESVAVAVDAAGEHLVAWGRAASSGLWLDGAGNARGGVFPVVYNGTLSGDPGLDLAMTASGRLVVAFVAGDVYARLLPPEARGGVLQLVDEPGGAPWSALVEEELEVSVQVARTGGVAGEVSVEHFTAGGTATPGVDYTSAAGRLDFAEGEFLKSFPLAVHEDEVREGPEDLTVALRNPQGALLRDPAAYTVTLYDDESTLPGEGPYPRGEKRRANQTAGGSIPRPRVAVRPDGSFFVVWSDDPPGAPTDWTVRGRLYDAAGQSVGDEIAISEEPQVRPPGPSVLATSDGFLVTWTAGRSRVLGRRIEARGAPGETFDLARCGAFYVCSNTAGTEVAPGDDGSFVVVWAGDHNSSYSYGGDVSFFEAQLFAEDATPIGETTWIEGSLTHRRLRLGVSPRRSDGFLVVWNDNDCNLMSRRLDTAGDGEVHRLGRSCDAAPAVVRPGGEGFVLYDEARLPAPSDAFGGLADAIGLEITGRNLDAEGAPLSEPFLVNGFSPVDQADPRAAASASGKHIVVWASDGEPGPGRRSIVAQLYDAAGRRLGRRFAVRPSNRLQSAPDVAMTPDGDAFVVVWGEGNGLGGFDVYAQPYVGSSCLSGGRKLCLNEGRFELRVTWRDFKGKTGEGFAVPLTDDTGAFYFFGPENLELMVKVLDGRHLTGHFWVFYGSLSNVEFTLTVTDTSNGNSRRYVNPLGTFASVGDVRALPGD